MFTFYQQLNIMDCGPACLRMVAKYYGKHFTTEGLREAAGFSKTGVSLLGISDAAEKIGFRSTGLKLTYQELASGLPFPAILHWNQEHFVVLVAIKKSSFFRKETRLYLADPEKGMMSYKKEEFMRQWISGTSAAGNPTGTALLLEPTQRFHENKGEKENRVNWTIILNQLRQKKGQIATIFLMLLLASLLQLSFPFLTQSIVDKGIKTRDLNFITLILLAQLMLLFSRSIVDFIRSRLLLHLSSFINLSILSDFWLKLTKLPLSYFDAHRMGDTMQRISDNKQIQSFLTGHGLTTLFSLFTFVLYTVVLATYDRMLFLIFITGSLLYFLWIRVFLGIRRKINYQAFHVSAKENAATLHLIQGMQEIRLNNAGQIKRREWENLQKELYRLNFKSLRYSQFQEAGALLINQGKDVLITFLVATLVIRGKLTLGAMLAIQYVIGQLSGPVEQFVGFVQSAQDARISIERLNEVHQLTEEERPDHSYLHELPACRSIFFNDLSFIYPGAGNEPVLKNISLEIQEGKVTAIVGVSGSGKTTLLKLLLKFYDSYSGEIRIGSKNTTGDGNGNSNGKINENGSDNGNINTDFRDISPSFWRSQCGAVMQDGYIFNDSIARNIAVSDESPDHSRLDQSCRIANILPLIRSLPNGYDTLLGSEGVGLSQGQKQRLLIARAVYKNPRYLFFDEATNALDANNEKTIVENLASFFTGRTVVVIAHRLSTVKQADNIIVLHEGKIAEKGTHQELSVRKGIYYALVKNQLDMEG